MTVARRAALVALVVGAVGCKEQTTGVVVTVAGSGVQADQLRVVAITDGTTLPAALVPAAAQPLTLPVTFFAALPDATHAVVFDVTALAAGAPVAHAVSSSVALSPHAEPAVTIDLLPASDGSVPICGPGATPTACSGFTFCDSFETESGTAFSAWTQLAVANSGGGAANAGTGITVHDGAPVCAGSRSLHAVTVGNTQQAFVYKSGLAFPSTTHLRAFVYLPSTTPSGASFDLFSFAAAAQYLQLGYDSATGKLFVFRNFSSELDFPTTLPTDRWVCLEATLRFDATAGSVSLAVDGNVLGTQSPTATQPAGTTFDTFDAGLVFATTAAEVYLDEIVLSATPIGCR